MTEDVFARRLGIVASLIAIGSAIGGGTCLPTPQVSPYVVGVQFPAPPENGVVYAGRSEVNTLNVR